MSDIIGIAFTEKGTRVLDEIAIGLKQEFNICFKSKKFKAKKNIQPLEENYKDFIKNNWNETKLVIFIGAMGIAVRTIAPLIESKIKDPAVICLDEKSEYIIPILSGHIGGANAFAIKISKIINAKPIITTATDINNKLAIDVFAKHNNLFIDSMEKAKYLAMELLENKNVYIYCEKKLTNVAKGLIVIYDLSTFLEKTKLNMGIYIGIKNIKGDKILNLVPKIINIGVGCKKNTRFEVFEKRVMECIEQQNYNIDSLKNMASIDLKKYEECLNEFSKKYNIPFSTFSAKNLKNQIGNFTHSDFVEKVTGVGNICETSALKVSENGAITMKKNAKEGVTVSFCVEEWSIDFE